LTSSATGTGPTGWDWLNEAAAESYIPLLTAFNRLGAEGRRSGYPGDHPILAEMLAAQVFRREFKDYLDNKVQAAKDDLATFKKLGDDHSPRGQMWKPLRGSETGFCEDFGEDLIGAFRR